MKPTTSAEVGTSQVRAAALVATRAPSCGSEGFRDTAALAALSPERIRAWTEAGSVRSRCEEMVVTGSTGGDIAIVAVGDGAVVENRGVERLLVS